MKRLIYLSTDILISQCTNEGGKKTKTNDKDKRQNSEVNGKWNKREKNREI